MDKELLNEILTIVKKEEKKHKVEKTGHEDLSEVIYNFKYANNTNTEELKSLKREAELAQVENKAKESASQKSAKGPRGKKLTKAEIGEELREEQVGYLLENIAGLSKDDIESEALTFELDKLLLYKKSKALHQVIDSNQKYQKMMTSKLNIAAFNVINANKPTGVGR